MCDLAELQAVACHDEGRGGVASVSGLLRSAPGCPKRWLFALSSVRYAMVWCGFRVCYRVGGCTQKGSSYGGLVVKSCAIPVWKLSFVLILCPWPHIGPVPGATLGCLWGPGCLPKRARRLPRDNPRRPKPFPWIASGLPLGAGPPEGRRGPQGGNPGDPKGASRCRGAQFFKKHSKTMSISLRRNVHAVEARSPYWSKEGAGRTRITT